MRPRHLYNALFIWLALSGGRFTAPFLENISHFSDTVVGLALAMQVGLGALLAPMGGIAADSLERSYPHRGRAFVLSFGILLGTVAFLLHGVVWSVFRDDDDGTDDDTDNNEISSTNNEWEISCHMFLRVLYSVGLAFTFPVIDGMTLAYLEEEGSNQSDFGKERLYGAFGWAIFSIILGPFIDKFGFEVIFVFAPAGALFFFGTITLYVKESMASQKGRKVSGEEPCNVVDVDSTTCAEETEDRHVDFDIDLVTNSEVDAEMERSENLEETRQKHLIWNLLRMICSTPYGACFIFCTFTLSMGMSVVESLIFLFFEELGGTNALMGLTVAVTVMFEIPILGVAPKLLELLGPGRLQQIACIAYAARVVGYTLVPANHVALVLLLEPLHGVTYACSKTSGVEFVARYSPKGYEASGQGLLGAVTGIGSVLGLSAGGWAEDALGPHEMYRGFALVVSIGLLVSCLSDRMQPTTGEMVPQCDVEVVEMAEMQTFSDNIQDNASNQNS